MRTGVVIIGRNEGERLRSCLSSLRDGLPSVYVDSGSSDGSVLLASGFGFPTIALTPDRPYSAARARNAGLRALLRREPALEAVQYVDGDCTLAPGWLGAAQTELANDHGCALVCGQLAELAPEASLFNQLCALEWQGPSGTIDECGGLFMARVRPLLDVDGFDEGLIAGEEPDLCYRLRQRGWTLRRIATAMAVHDAAMFHPRQWWARSVRSGFGDMLAAERRGRFEPKLRRRVLSNFFWAAPPAWLLWPLLWWRIRSYKGSLYAAHVVIGKVPHAWGQLRYLAGRARQRAPTIIEHKIQ